MIRIEVVWILGVFVGFFIGRRQRREVRVTYHPVDLKEKLAAIAPAFRGHQLTGTTFRVHNEKPGGDCAFVAVQKLIVLATSAAEEKAQV